LALRAPTCKPVLPDGYIMVVMPGLVPGIHVFWSRYKKPWMAGQARP
jgi:hypothetical protein